MKIYNYSDKTGEYLSESEAKEDPRVNGSFLVPALATTKKPLECGDKEVNCFINGDWAIKKDLRGTTIYKQDNPYGAAMVESIGDIPDGWSFDEPAESIEKKEIDEIRNQRNAAFAYFESKPARFSILMKRATDAQVGEFETYCQSLLDAPQTMTMRERPAWLEV
jgi:hypothetical protein